MRLYNITKELHKAVKATADKFGKEVEISNRSLLVRYQHLNSARVVTWKYSRISDYDERRNHRAVVAIDGPQVKHILKAFKDELGENPESLTYDYYEDDYPNVHQAFEDGVTHGQTPKLRAEALCKEWLDGLDPLIESEPEQVLRELTKILSNCK